MGPIEILVVKFPGNEFKGEIAPALRDLVESGTIRIIDLIFAIKNETGDVAVVELNDLSDDEYGAFDPVVSDTNGMLSEEDAREIGETLERDSSAALMLFENVWAEKFRDAVLNAKGELVMNERIPKAVVDEIMASEPERV
jgi:hypothetical protein